MREKRLPWNGKEGLLYGCIIAIISCFVMMTLSIGTNMGTLASKEMWTALFRSLPLVFVVVMFWESLVIGRIAHWLVSKFMEPTDGFNANILFTIVFTAGLMSMSMSIIGPFLGGEPIKEIILAWPHHWPRNFCIAFWCECLLAQPIARKVMVVIHNRGEKKMKLEMEEL